MFWAVFCQPFWGILDFKWGKNDLEKDMHLRSGRRGEVYLPSVSHPTLGFQGLAGASDTLHAA
jgi:hypothetical protein